MRQDKRLMSDKHRDLAYRIARYLLVVLIPIATGLVFFKNLEIHPFGENSLLSVDLWGQYYPMFRQFARTDSLAGAMYSWNGALGFNNYVQSAFYCRSLFLIPFKWVPIEQSIVYIDAVCLLRLGLSALTCLLFLEYKFQKRSPLITALAVSYGLCAYGIAFIMQFMWTDLMIYAPLVLLGLERIFRGHSPLVYIVALGVTIYSNFYVAFGVCLFTLCYFVAELVKRIDIDPTARWRRRVVNFRELKTATGHFVLSSLVAGAGNAVLLIPTLIGLSKTSSASTAQVDFSKWYHTMAQTIDALLPQTEVSLEYGVANIATGLFLFLFVPLYFMNRSIRFRDKLATGSLLAVLYMAMNFNPMDYVFNGFHFPNQLPGRWSFLLSLLLVMVAANGLVAVEGIRASTVVSSFLVGTSLLLFTRYSTLSEIKAEKLTLWVVCLAVAALCMLVWVWCRGALQKTTPSPDKVLTKVQAVKRTCCRVGVLVLTATVSLLMIAEVSVNTVHVASAEKGGVRTSSMTHYLHATGVFDTYGALYDSGDDEFYRVENNQGWTFNDGQLGGYKGISYYGSTMNGNVYQLLRYLGNRVYTLNISTLYNNSSPVQNGIFGIRYFIDKGKNLSERLEGIDQVAEYEDCIVWENPTALPLGFIVSDRIYNIHVSDEIYALTAQNDLLNAMLGFDINVYEKQSRTQETESGAAEYVFVCPDDRPVYIEQNFGSGTLTATVGDQTINIDAGTELFKYLGRYPAGTTIRIRTETADPAAEGKDLQFYLFDEQKWQNAYEQLNANSLDVTSFSETKVTGTITMESTGMLFTSIPQDGGWSVYVDGKKVQEELVGESLIAVRLNGGEHTVTFRYRVPGLVIGAIITALVLAFAVWYLWRFAVQCRKPCRAA